nr:TMV resistance protein N [Tanacetum cinerariifolium]
MNPSSSSVSPSSSKRKRNDSIFYEEPNCKKAKNDIFMNYSFEDIGQSFISHLRQALSRNSFTISHHTVLPVGQDMRLQLFKAIEESGIYVVVFSTNYASSVRCLDELVHIMDCLGKLEQRKVLPVFYKVDPSDVRSQKGSFMEAFLAHETNVDPERVQNWKQDLKDAGQLSGLTMQNGDEAKFILEIIEEVEKMQSPQELHVTDHPVGIGSRAEELISKLELDCEDVLVVAVFGISGIGKTTIVKATFNKIAAKFDVSCFLGDIHYNCGGPNWKDLPTLFISCLTQNDKFSIMNRHNCHNDRVTKIKRESLNLFTRLMFSRDSPVDMQFVKEVVAHAGGLPLILKVWSRHFKQFQTEQWPSILDTLKKIPHGDVQKQLQMSYDSLTNRAKKLFLDIACFFRGIEKDTVVKDMGREIIRQENEDEPGKRTRLRDDSDVLSGTESIESIRFEYAYEKKKEIVQLEAFRSMINLRLLSFFGPDLSWTPFDDDMPPLSFKKLKYLHWDRFPMKNINIDMGNLVVLRLGFSKLEILWEGFKNLKKLRILDLNCSHSLIKTSDFSGLENLKEMSFRGCNKLEELYNSIGCLNKLAILNLADCTRLKRFPWDMLSKLLSLRKLFLSRCENIGLELEERLEGIKLWKVDYRILFVSFASTCNIYYSTSGGCRFQDAWLLIRGSHKKLHNYKIKADCATHKEEPVRRGPEAGAPGSTLRRSSQNRRGSTRVHVSGDCARTLGFPWLDDKDPPGNANMAFDLRPTEDVLPWPSSANMAFDLRPTEDVLPWPGSANMAFNLRPTDDVLPWPGSANMAFDLRSTEDLLPCPGSANMAFDLRPTEDSGSANMAFDLLPTKDVLPWPSSANMAFDLWPTEDILSWPGSANMAFDLRPTEDVLPWPVVRIWHSTYGRRKTYFRGRVVRIWHSTLRYFRGRVVRIWHSTYGRRKTYFCGRVVRIWHSTYGRRKTYFRDRVVRIWHSTYGRRKTYFRGRVVRIWHSTYDRRKTYFRGR